MARLVFIAVFAIQFAIPASSVLFDLRDKHYWSWSMFSGYQYTYKYSLDTSAGWVEADSLEAGWFRGRIRYGSYIPNRLCELHPEATRVRWERFSAGNYHDTDAKRVGNRTYPCVS